MSAQGNTRHQRAPHPRPKVPYCKSPKWQNASQTFYTTIIYMHEYQKGITTHIYKTTSSEGKKKNPNHN